MGKVIVIGGGWSGCAASIAAKKAGADVTLIERTDMLLGLGNVGGVFRNNGRYTAAEECILLGGRELFEIMDNQARHTNINFPGHKHASIYDVNFIESSVRRELEELGINIIFENRAVNINKKEKVIKYVILENGKKLYGDCFIDATGSTGPMINCVKNGNGCVMCILRCPTFKGRVSITSKCGVKEINGRRDDGSYGSFSGSIKLSKETLSLEIQNKLNSEGVAIVPLPKEEINEEKLKIKVCKQYALEDFVVNLILLDTGHAKLMAPYYPLEKLRKIKGFENVKYEDPYSAGRGNSIRHFQIAYRDNFMKAVEMDNLFVAGEKSGFYVGHTEAVVTGYLAGHNSVRKIANKELLQLPRSLAIGDFISYSNEMMHKPDGDKLKFTFAGSTFFKRMVDNKLYSIDRVYLHRKIQKHNLLNIYDKRII